MRSLATLGFGLLLIVLVGNAVLSSWATERLIADNGEVVHGHQTLSEAAASDAAVARWTLPLGTALAAAFLLGGYGLLLRDRGRRERAAEQVRREREWLGVTLRGVGDGVIATDGVGRVRFLNPVAEELTGWRQEEAAGRPISEIFPIVHERTRAPVENPVGRVLREGAVVGLANHTLLIARDGRERPIDDSGGPIRSEKGEIVGAVLVFRDVTERRRAEAALAERTRLAEYGAEVGAVLTRSATLAEMLRLCTEATVRLLDAAFARIWTLNAAGDLLELQASSGLYTHLDGPHGRVSVGQLKIGLIAQERKPHLTNAVVGDPRVGDQEWARREGMVAFAGYPLVVEDRLVGVVALFARRPLTEVVLQALASVADEIAMGIDRKRAEESERRQREWLHVTLSSVGDAVIATDAEGRVSFLNAVAEVLTGWPQAEAAGRPLEEVFRILNEETRRPVETPARRVLAEGVVVGLANHTVLVARDGVEWPVADSAAPIRTAAGAVQGVVLVFRDATEARRAETAFREEKRQADALLRVASLLSQEHDLHRLVQVATDEATRLTGAQFGAFFYNVHNAEGESYTLYALSGTRPDAFARFPMPRNTAIFEPTFRGQGVLRLDDVTRDPRYGKNAPYRGMPEGHPPVRSYLAVPVVSRSGEVLGGLFFGHAEAAVFDERDEQLVVGVAAQAAVAIDNARLYEQLRNRAEELAEADRRKDNFLAMLGHELRNPLAPIRNAVTILDLSSDAGAVGQAHEMIGRQVTHLTRLVDELLDASRIANGKIQLRRERLDLARLVRVAARDHRPELEAAGLSVADDAPEAPVWVDGDAVRLTQVVSNLLQNAAKFTDAGGRVAVTVAADAEAGRAVATVRDSGVGIDAAMIGRLFETFAQADRSLERSRGGLGLGLALSKGLVELHGGRIEAASEGLGRGAEFRFWLPLAEAPADVAEAPTPETAASGRRKILIIEDNRDAADSLQLLLQLSGGHVVMVAYSGTDGVEAARSFRPDVVLCDLGLPGLSGFEVAQALRADPATASALLVAVSGYGQEEDRRRAREAGFDEAAVKPVDPAVLERLAAVGRRRGDA